MQGKAELAGMSRILGLINVINIGNNLSLQNREKNIFHLSKLLNLVKNKVVETPAGHSTVSLADSSPECLPVPLAQGKTQPHFQVCRYRNLEPGCRVCRYHHLKPGCRVCHSQSQRIQSSSHGQECHSQSQIIQSSSHSQECRSQFQRINFSHHDQECRPQSKRIQFSSHGQECRFQSPRIQFSNHGQEGPFPIPENPVLKSRPGVQ